MDLERQATGIGALADPTRRALYQYVVAQTGAVGREQAATAVGVTVSTAGFHLDKLADEGLLDTEFRRLTGRTGPGAGRPSKLYRRGETEFALSLPARRYDLVGEILAAAFDRAAGGVELQSALAECANGAGAELGEQARRAGSRPDLDNLAAVLSSQGYEARVTEARWPRWSWRTVPSTPWPSATRRWCAASTSHYVQGVADGLRCVGSRGEARAGARQVLREGGGRLIARGGVC